MGVCRGVPGCVRVCGGVEGCVGVLRGVWRGKLELCDLGVSVGDLVVT